GVVDICVGIALSGFLPIPRDTISLLAFLSILKGLYSILTSIGSGFYFDILGFLDLLGGFALLLLAQGLHHGIFVWIGALILLKGIISTVSALK
ncbi:MAG: hypothetical protein DRP11_04115, partial [Candidatus Aenigmatarchaeota archaeon]